ncbi:PPE domain-containing protein [Mycobacterium sp. NPDC003323]
MTGSLNVEPADLRGKAATLDVPLPPAPENPQPPCGLALAGVAVAQITAEGDGMKAFIAAGQQEAQLLSKALAGAADVYERTDEAGRAAIEGTAGQIANVDIPVPDISIPQPHMPIGACPAPPGYLDVETAAQQITQPDQAATLDAVAQEWNGYGAKLTERAGDFDLDSVNWEGTAAEMAGTALRRHKEWLQQMAAAATEIAEHARDLAEVHRKAVAEHPTVAEVQAISAQLRMTTDAAQMSLLMAEYQKLQARSEEVLGEYAAQSAIKAVNPPTPPIREALSPRKGDRGKSKKTFDRGPDVEANMLEEQGPGTGTDGGSGAGGGTGGPPSQQPTGLPPTAQPQPDPAQSGAGSPAGMGAPSGGAPSGGAPSGGGSPAGGGKPGGGLPGGGLPGGGLPGGSPETGLPDLGLDDPGVSPAGLGGGSAGGSGGGGGGGVPSMPLQPNVGAETVAPAPANGGARAGTGSGAIPASAMGGGMGMGGMGGMGHGGAQQGQQKRRDPRFAPDEELYTEDRPYTEPVIGNRRRKDVQDKEPK